MIFSRVSRVGVAQHGLATLAYLALALWCVRPVLFSAGTDELIPARMWPGTVSIMAEDQRMVTWLVARNARVMLQHPAQLLEGEQCHPLPRSITFGEHMFGAGLLGAVPFAATRDPILTANAVAALGFWIAGVAMYALAAYWTRNLTAAFIAGVLFALSPSRLADPVHPYLTATYWIPPALLFLHRVFLKRSWLDALALSLFVCLQLLESFYLVLSLTILGSVYGVYLIVRYRRELRTIAPKLLLAGTSTALFAWMLLGPYLSTRATWGNLADRKTFLVNLGDYFPGRFAYQGTVLVFLAVVGVADRLRRARRERGRLRSSMDLPRRRSRRLLGDPASSTAARYWPAPSRPRRARGAVRPGLGRAPRGGCSACGVSFGSVFPSWIRRPRARRAPLAPHRMGDRG